MTQSKANSVANHLEQLGEPRSSNTFASRLNKRNWEIWSTLYGPNIKYTAGKDINAVGLSGTRCDSYGQRTGN